MSVCLNYVSDSRCAYLYECMHTRVRVCFCVDESGDLAERGRMPKMLSHHVLARDTWLELAKLLREQPKPKC